MMLSTGMRDVALFQHRMSVFLGNVMIPSASEAQVKSARCPRCGNSFDCGMHAPPPGCWCKAMPALPADRLQPGGRCLCPECLAGEIARAQERAGGMKGGISFGG
jgi:hypothetical protein